eukprot:scaffold33197_cov112-Isochrysis_galbana.AAC.1
MLRARPIACHTIVTPRRPRPGVTRRVGREKGGFEPGRHFEAYEDEGRPRVPRLRLTRGNQALRNLRG